MKRSVLLLAVPLLLSGCAELFDANLYGSVDTPPAVSLSGKTAADVEAMMADDSFFVSLKSDPAALDAAQAILDDGFVSVTSGSSAADKAAAVTAAQAYIEVTANGSEAGEVVQEAILQASKLAKGTAADAKSALVGLTEGKSAAEITTILNNFLEMSTALTAMQTAATSGTSVNADAFFGTAENQGELAQVALVAAAVSALVTDVGSGAGYSAADVSAMAAQLAAGQSPTLASGTATTALAAALAGTTDPATNKYAYLSAVTSILPL